MKERAKAVMGDLLLAGVKPDDEIVLLFDTKLMKPGCVLLQAAAGCGQNNTFLQMTFENWLLAPTPNMKRIKAKRSLWEAVAKKFDKK
jgi:hypothetical protein